MIEIKKFYVVWREDSGTPRKKHETKESAMMEAERLALLNQGSEFHVLEAVGTCAKQETFWVFY